MPTLSKPDIKLVRALQKDFETLYVKEFTTAWKENRLIRNIELGIMRLENTEKYIATQNTALLKEVADKVIGADELLRDDEQLSAKQLKEVNKIYKARNFIRAEQRSKLAAMGEQ